MPVEKCWIYFAYVRKTHVVWKTRPSLNFISRSSENLQVPAVERRDGVRPERTSLVDFIAITSN